MQMFTTSRGSGKKARRELARKLAKKFSARYFGRADEGISAAVEEARFFGEKTIVVVKGPEKKPCFQVVGVLKNGFEYGSRFSNVEKLEAFLKKEAKNG